MEREEVDYWMEGGSEVGNCLEKWEEMKGQPGEGGGGGGVLKDKIQSQILGESSNSIENRI